MTILEIKTPDQHEVEVTLDDGIYYVSYGLQTHQFHSLHNALDHARDCSIHAVNCNGHFDAEDLCKL